MGWNLLTNVVYTHLLTMYHITSWDIQVINGGLWDLVHFKCFTWQECSRCFTSWRLLSLSLAMFLQTVQTVQTALVKANVGGFDMFFFVVMLLKEEILHQLIWSISQYLQGFIYARWCRISSINSIFPHFFVFTWQTVKPVVRCSAPKNPGFCDL